MAKKIKNILITTENYYPVGGGTEQFIRGIAEFLTSKGFVVFIYAQNYPDRNLTGEFRLKEGVINYSPLMEGSMKEPFRVIDNKYKFSEFIHSKNIDFVFANNHNSLAWIKASSIAKVPVIYGCHGVGLMDPFKSRFLKPNDEISWGFPGIVESIIWLSMEKKKLWKKIIGGILFFVPGIKYDRLRNYWRYKKSMKILDSADGRYGNSLLTSKLFFKQKNTFGFPLAINASNPEFSNYFFTEIEPSFLKEFNLKHKQYIMCPGRITNIKGQEYAIKALAKLNDKKIKLVLAGNTSLFLGETHEIGSYGEELKKIIKNLDLEDRVIFTGLLSLDEIRKMYSSAFLSVIPSVWLETFGYVTIESMSCETPVIVTKNCGSAKCVDKSSGFIIDRKSEDQIADIINNNSIEDFIKMGKQARKRVLDNYDWGVLGSNYIEMINEVNNGFYERN